MIARLLKQSLIGLGALGVLLLVPAGTLYWPAAWVFLVTMTILGFVLFFVGVPLLLGSWWGVAMVPLFIALFAIRAVIEERALIAGLPGYANYITRVRYRLLPGLW